MIVPLTSVEQLRLRNFHACNRAIHLGYVRNVVEYFVALAYYKKYKKPPP